MERKKDCIINCIGPDCEGCKTYKTGLSDKLAEEIIRKNIDPGDSLNYVSLRSIIDALHEYHEAKLKEELRSFLVYHDLQLEGDYNKHWIIEFIDEYLKARNNEVI